MEDPNGGGPGAGSPTGNGNSNGGGGKGKQASPKGRDMFKNQRRESEGSVDCPNLEFEYGDADEHGAELSELYSYTENPEFTINRHCFEEDFRTQVQGRGWLELEEASQKAYIMRLLNRLEVVNREQRLKVARAILYLAQGTFGECDTEADILHWSRYNSFLLYQMGTFTAFLELLHMETDNSQACSSALRKPAISLADSTELRVLLSVMYLMVENIRLERETDPSGWRAARETFRTELSEECDFGERQGGFGLGLWREKQMAVLSQATNLATAETRLPQRAPNLVFQSWLCCHLGLSFPNCKMR